MMHTQLRLAASPAPHRRRPTVAACRGSVQVACSQQTAPTRREVLLAVPGVAGAPPTLLSFPIEGLATHPLHRPRRMLTTLRLYAALVSARHAPAFAFGEPVNDAQYLTDTAALLQTLQEASTSRSAVSIQPRHPLLASTRACTSTCGSG